MKRNRIKALIILSLALVASSIVVSCNKSFDNKEGKLVKETSSVDIFENKKEDIKVEDKEEETNKDAKLEEIKEDNLYVKSEEKGSNVNYSLDSYNTSKIGKVTNAEHGLNVRVEPSIYSKSLGLIDNNTVIEVLGSTGDWYKVTTCIGSGFVHKNYLKVDGIEYVYDSELEYKLGKVSYSSTINKSSVKKNNKDTNNKNNSSINTKSFDNKENKPAEDNKESKLEDNPVEDNKYNKPVEDNKDSKPIDKPVEDNNENISEEDTKLSEDKPSEDNKEDKPSEDNKEDKPSNTNEPPVITADDLVIRQNETFSISMLNIKAIDKEDGNITKDVYVGKSVVNTTIPGIYNVSVFVKDSTGVISSKVVKVTVEGVAPSISASNIEINQNESFNNNMLNAKAVDANGNNITSSIKYSGTVDTYKAGTYDIILTVADEFGTSNSCKAQVTVKAVEQKYNPNTSGFNRILNSKMLSLVNNHRANNGIKSLTLDSNIEECSTEKSKHMVDNDYFDHYYNGKLYWQMNYKYSNNGICAENIAYNWITTEKLSKEDIEYIAEVLFNQWKNSAGHNKNMLNSDYTRFGFGAYVRNDGAIYATQEFGW